MNYTVYILYSANLKRYYIGQTDDLSRRLAQHTSKQHATSFTAKARDWQLVLELKCSSREQARRLENFIKRMKSRKFVDQLRVDIEMQTNLINRFK